MDGEITTTLTRQLGRWAVVVTVAVRAARACAARCPGPQR
jgi:hypothetical protein